MVYYKISCLLKKVNLLSKQIASLSKRPKNKLANQNIIAILIAANVLAANTVYAADDIAVHHRVSSDNANDSLVPEGISDVVSDVDMRVRLATKANLAQCIAEICQLNQAFDTRVQQLGAQLSTAAYAQFPTLKNAYQY